MSNGFTNDDVVMITSEFYEIMKMHYPRINDMLSFFKVSVNLPNTDYLDNNIISVNYDIDMDADDNLIIPLKNRTIICNNIIAFCDISDLVTYINYNLRSKEGMYLRQFFVNLMRYSKKVSKRIGNKTNNVVIKIGNDYYLNIKDLEKGIKINKQ